MTHQVVSRLLLGAVQVVKGDAQGVRGHHAVGADGETHAVQRPVQCAGVEAKLRVQCACGRQTGADTQDGILRGDHCYIWVMKTHNIDSLVVVATTCSGSGCYIFFFLVQSDLLECVSVVVKLEGKEQQQKLEMKQISCQP